jgi:lipoprotein-releasing system permease protein
MSYEFFIAKRYLKSKRKTGFISLITYISIGGVMVGVAALVIVLSVMNGFEQEVRTRIVGTDAHIRVTTFYNRGIEDYEKIISEIEQVDHVIAVTPFIYWETMITAGQHAAGARIIGADSLSISQVTDLAKNMIHGQPTFVATDEQGKKQPGLILGITLANRLKVWLDDEVIALSPKTYDGSSLLEFPRAKRFIVSGLFETGLYEYDASLAYMSLSDAQKFFQMGDTVTGLGMKLDDMYRAKSVSKRISELLGYPFFTTDWMEQNKTLFNWMTIEKWAMFIILSLIIMVAAFNIISTLIMVVLEKRKEIGILKSMGATSKSIMKIFMFEGLVVGIIGTLFGCAVGYLLCWAQNTFHFFQLPPEIYFISTLPVLMQPTDFLFVSTAGIAICFFATLYPAKRAARLDPVEAMRYE